MKTYLISLFIFGASFHASAQLNDDFKLPAAWTKDFTISLSYSGSMDGSNTSLRFTYDSCIYNRNSGMNAPKKNIYLLTESDRIAILKKLHELKADQIHSEASMVPVNDGWSTLICFGGYHCVAGGTSAQMSEHDKEVFSKVYGYLEEFAQKKAKR